MSGLDERLEALARAATLAEGRLDDGAVAAARATVGRAGGRLGLDVDTTVAALAGPTGAGKSSLFNALAGRELSPAGVRRPTTSTTAAAVRGDVDAALLDWTGAATRHRIAGEGPLVLLDLPDVDSVQTANRDEAERVVAIADLLVWVCDPQKYADAVLHDRELRPLAAHRDVVVVVLNQADRLDDAARRACLDDLERLLVADGLAGVPVLACSAATGEGVGALRALLDERAAGRAAAVARLSADVTVAARGLDAGCTGRPRAVPKAARAEVETAFAEAAGVPAVVHAVRRSHRRRGTLAAGWPPGRLLVRLRVDPLRRLRLGEAPDGDVRTSLPPASPAQRARAATALRALAGHAAGDLPEPWPRLVRRAALAREAALPEALDRAVAATALPLRAPRWWWAARWVQRLLVAAAMAGALWLVVLTALAFLRLQDVVPLPRVEGVPAPTLLLVAGLLAGLLLALLARWVNAVGAARRGRRSGRRLHRAIAEVAQAEAIAPVAGELAVRDELCAALRAAQPSRT